MIPFKVGLHNAIEKLQQQKEKPFVLLAQHGTMSIEYFAPKIKDTQTPHLQDEIYIIASGTALFFRKGISVNCTTGDILFVPAHTAHYFENFSDDFATWVIFYGVAGGEKNDLEVGM